MAPFDVHADSKQEADSFGYWTGASTPATPGTAETTCNGWMSSAADVHGIIGREMNIEPGSWFDLVSVSCDFPSRIYCLQQ
jgi:hypothetical protein